MENNIEIKKSAINQLKQMILSDEEMDIKYLYENSEDYKIARELMRLKLQEIVNN
jgi:hypothetical protein